MKKKPRIYFEKTLKSYKKTHTYKIFKKKFKYTLLAFAHKNKGNALFVYF